jgi:hypothetical protein
MKSMLSYVDRLPMLFADSSAPFEKKMRFAGNLHCHP